MRRLLATRSVTGPSTTRGRWISWHITTNARLISGTPAFAANYSQGVTIVTNDNSTNQDDLLVGSQTGATRTGANGSLITFKHAQSYLRFRARSTVAYNSTANSGITVTGITLSQAAHNGTLSVTRGDGDAAGAVSMSWSGQGTKKDGVPVPGVSSQNLGSGSWSDLGSGILVPTQASSGQYVTIYYTQHNGVGADVAMQYNYFIDGTAWSPSTQY